MCCKPTPLKQPPPPGKSKVVTEESFCSCFRDKDIVDPTIKRLVTLNTLPRWLLWLLSWPLQLATKVSGKPSSIPLGL